MAEELAALQAERQQQEEEQARWREETDARIKVGVCGFDFVLCSCS